MYIPVLIIWSCLQKVVVIQINKLSWIENNPSFGKILSSMPTGHSRRTLNNKGGPCEPLLI